MNENFKRIKYKILMLLPTLFIISGCASSNNSDYVGSCGFMDIGCYITETKNNFSLDFTQWWWNLLFSMHDASNDLSNGFTDNVFNTFSGMKELSSIISVSSTIGIIFIFIKYGWGIFRYYSIQLDEGVSPLTIEYIKKTVFAMLFVFLAPYIIINGFYLTTVVTNQAAILLKLHDNSGNDVNIRDALSNDVTLGTWCGNVADDAGIEAKNDYTDGKENIIIRDSYKDGNKEVEKNLTNSFSVLWKNKEDGGEGYSGSKMTSYYNNFCDRNESKKEESGYHGTYVDGKLNDENVPTNTQTYKPINVYVAIMHSPDLLAQVPSGGLIGFLNFFIAILFGIFTTFNVGIRVAELLVLIMMTPFFGMQYISVRQSEALSTWCKELISIFMTHAITVLLFKIYLDISVSLSGVSGIPILFGLMLIQMRGPSALRAWSHNTGSFGVMNGLRRAANKNS